MTRRMIEDLLERRDKQALQASCVRIVRQLLAGGAEMPYRELWGRVEAQLGRTVTPFRKAETARLTPYEHFSKRVGRRQDDWVRLRVRPWMAEPATHKQEWLLRKHGQWTNGMTKGEAHALIDEIKAEEKSNDLFGLNIRQGAERFFREVAAR